MNSLRENADLLHLLGHPTRLAIVQRLADGPKCVTDIQELLDVPQANVSQHLMALRSRRIVDCHEHGNLRCYYIARPNLAQLLMKFLAEDYPVVERSAAGVRQAALRCSWVDSWTVVLRTLVCWTYRRPHFNAVERRWEIELTASHGWSRTSPVSSRPGNTTYGTTGRSFIF